MVHSPAGSAKSDADDPVSDSVNSANAHPRINELSERQLCYLRLVHQHRTSKEIASLTGVSPRAVDKQLLKANNLLGTASRVDSARIVIEHDKGVEPLPPATVLPSDDRVFPLPLPLPTARMAVNMLTWKQVAIWILIIAILTPIGLTVAGMVMLTLTYLFGLKVR